MIRNSSLHYTAHTLHKPAKTLHKSAHTLHKLAQTLHKPAHTLHKFAQTLHKLANYFFLTRFTSIRFIGLLSKPVMFSCVKCMRWS